jgi:squalene-hopene/tetraprenyl-beta-curcumene cyclase
MNVRQRSTLGLIVLAALGAALGRTPRAAGEPNDAPHGAAHADALPADATADEPLALAFSPERAAGYLDAVALDWVKVHACTACHTMPSYLMARPALTRVSPEPPDVRRFFDDIATGRQERFPDYLPADGRVSIVVVTAVSLAMHDRATSGKLQPATRRALDEMWTWQQPDGSWQWPHRDSPPIKLDEHYGATYAAIGVGMAPGDYARGESAAGGLSALRRYLAARPPVSLHEKAMLAWASVYVDGLLDESARRELLEAVLAAQRPDGGWALASLVDNLAAPSAALAADCRAAAADPGYGAQFQAYWGDNAVYRVPLASDGYATGFVVYVARQAGLPAADERLARGVAWLKANQRASGRWFTHSIGPPHTRHLISNSGTGYAVLALAACGELP